MTEFCRDKVFREWNLGPNVTCNGDFEHCKHVIYFGKNPYCILDPSGRVGPWFTVRCQAHCGQCRYFTNKLTSAKCQECLSADTRINYEQRQE